MAGLGGADASGGSGRQLGCSDKPAGRAPHTTGRLHHRTGGCQAYRGIRLGRPRRQRYNAAAGEARISDWATLLPRAPPAVKLQYAVPAVATLHGGIEPDLLDEVAWWQANDWQYALLAAGAHVRAAADRAGVPMHEACTELAERSGQQPG